MTAAQAHAWARKAVLGLWSWVSGGRVTLGCTPLCSFKQVLQGAHAHAAMVVPPACDAVCDTCGGGCHHNRVSRTSAAPHRITRFRVSGSSRTSHLLGGNRIGRVSRAHKPRPHPSLGPCDSTAWRVERRSRPGWIGAAGTGVGGACEHTWLVSLLNPTPKPEPQTIREQQSVRGTSTTRSM